MTELKRKVDFTLPDASVIENARKARDSFSRFMLNYRFATEELMTKIGILKTEFEHLHDYSPIEHVASRVKTVESILEKAQRRGIPFQRTALQQQMHDIAGVRVVCSFISDVYWIADMLSAQDDLSVLEVKDYIAAPKPNGYRSLHLIAQVPVFLSESTENVLVEIQIRTVAMDFWASLEHKIEYKFGSSTPAHLLEELTNAATRATELDETMQRIHNAAQEKDPDRRRRSINLEALSPDMIESFLDG